ncbi:MAG: hypothetical protein M3395_11595 [Chloroflexota bacterium]|nr:hypothetical protein [Chloroflexota bacterium]
MASLDGDDPGRRRESACRQVRRLAVVGGNARVLERKRRCDKCIRVGRRLPELHPRFRSGLAAQCLLEEGKMLLLVTSDDLCKRAELAPEGAPRAGFGVERRLDVFEEQREIENANVLGRGRRRRCEPGQSRNDHAPGCERSSGNDCALEEIGSRVS